MCVTFDSLNLKTTKSGIVDPKIERLTFTKIVIVNEVDKNVSFKFIKSITGKDVFSSRSLFSNDYSSIFHGDILATSNNLLKFDKIDVAIKRILKYFFARTRVPECILGSNFLNTEEARKNFLSLIFTQLLKKD
ncbi:hypothetical protein CDIK_1447 [Cucumispora dikerogammari]|nr:hypothetical protein CDIK_1447 [Cucumispora dikerogammari]